ncbi:sodium/glutamate symporter [Roseibium sp. MMSF_3412]|uniref:sodium/glutamate symporter n=1 Tax=Roseibium sp. MMSF_3412 TaxID=3046712 RepID=UPI00273F08C0|nr:sodium/glutamate symporter [Roseibium sp. MMSF_3412]
MEPAAATDPILIDSFAAFTLGIVVYFIGARLTKRFSILSAYSIPEPVSGGLAAAFCALLVVVATGRTIEYDLSVRDFLLVYFFTTVGLNARVSDLTRGGPVLAIMLGLTLVFMIVQNGVGALGALLFGLPSQAGVLLGTASLIGGHGTAIAWGPTIASQYGVTGAAELGIASATVGLILASILGGPIAKYLITKNSLSATDNTDGVETHEAAATDETRAPINHVEIMRCILWIHVAIVIGYSAHESLLAAGLKLPLFVPCLITGIVLSNVVPMIFRRSKSPAVTQSLDLINEFSLSVFLSMSLMSMELWTLAGSAGVLAATMVLQAVAATVFIVFVVFKVMGRNYFAAVLSAGFAGFALGATPTAIANMKAVTQRYGPSPLAFIVLPLISAFFVDLANAFIIQWFLSL